MDLGEFAHGNELFKNSFFKTNEKKLLTLVKEGQHPKALFIGCSDSRVIPDLIVSSTPGDLFVVRNVGNFIPPHKLDNEYHSTVSAIEYAVTVLKVSDIIVCGHTHCGACAHLYEELDDSLVYTKKWLELGEKAKQMALLSLGKDAEKEKLLRVTEKFSIVSQIDNLLTHPYVKKLADEEKLTIHGWYYHIENGDIEYYDTDSYSFKPLSKLS